MDSNAEITAARETFYHRLKSQSAAPLWQARTDLAPARPWPDCIAAFWRYEEMRPFVMESARLIGAAEADRRVLIIENPGLLGLPQVTQSLYAGLQLALPGEVSTTHRHASGALRFVIEGSGAYTSVNGAKVTMQPGDLVLTPAGASHDHGNLTDAQVVWLDGLDVPMVTALDSGFPELYPGGTMTALPGAGNSAISFPYTHMRNELERMASETAADPAHGFRIHYGGEATLPTIDAWLRLLPAGFKTRKYRSTDASVFCVAEGRGWSRIGKDTFHWGPHDIFMAPTWMSVEHAARKDAVLFHFSDRPMQKAVGMWREQSD